MAALTVGILASLIVVVDQSRRRAAAPSIDIDEALTTMGVTPGSGQAQRFALESLDGELVELGDFEGRVVFLNFWATWCAPCVEEMPAMQELSDAYEEKGLAMVAINVRENRSRVSEFVDMLGVDYTILLDPDGRAVRDFNVRGYPTTIIIGRNGEVIGTKLGFHRWDDPQTMEAFGALLEQV